MAHMHGSTRPVGVRGALFVAILALVGAVIGLYAGNIFGLGTSLQMLSAALGLLLGAVIGLGLR